MATTATGTRYASIYVRLSTQPGDANMSVEGMLSDSRDLAEREGYTVWAEHVDIGESGDSRDREGFEGWIDDARSGRVDALITWSLDRASRAGLGHLAQLYDVSDGIDMPRSVRLLDTQGLDSNQPGEAWRLWFAIKGEMARAELQAIRARNRARSERTRAARRYANRRPYGYDIADAEGGGKTLEPREDEAAVVRRIATLLLEGQSQVAIAATLTAEGIPTPRGAPDWTTNTVRALMRRPLTAGVYSFQRQPLREDDGQMVVAFPPLVPVDEWLQVCELIAPKNSPDTSQRGRPPRLLTGVALCAGCEKPLHRRYKTRGGVKYLCTHPRCDLRPLVPAELLEDHVTETVLDVFGDVRLSREVRVNRALVEASALEARKAELVSRIAADATDAEALTALTELQEQVKNLEAEPEIRVVRDEQTFRERWEAAAHQSELRELLSRAVEAVWVSREGSLSGVSKDQLPEAYLRRVSIEYTEEAEQQRDAQLSEAWDRHGAFE